MKNIKKIILILISFIVISVVYFKNGTDLFSMKDDSLEYVGIKKIENKKKTTTNSKGIKIQDAQINLLIDADAETMANLNYICGNDENMMRDILSKQEDLGKLSKEQIVAKNRIISECVKWYNFLDSLSKEELELLDKNNKENGELNTYFNTFKPYSKEMLNEARKFISSDEKSSNALLTIGALANLLSQDFDFMREIAIKLGTKDITSIANNNYNIAMLYRCEVAPAGCSANSLDMLSLCVQYEERCGLSYTQYYSSTVTPNKFADLINIVSIIRMLIMQGYFDDFHE